jgi:hypothetical protein
MNRIPVIDSARALTRRPWSDHGTELSWIALAGVVGIPALYMSVSTVKAHVTRLLSKLDVHNRVQIALRVQEAGL